MSLNKLSPTKAMHIEIFSFSKGMIANCINRDVLKSQKFQNVLNSTQNLLRSKYIYLSKKAQHQLLLPKAQINTALTTPKISG